MLGGDIAARIIAFGEAKRTFAIDKLAAIGLAIS